VTPSITVSTTPSISISVTPSVSVTPSFSVTPSISISRTPSVSVSATPSVSISKTPSISLTPTPSPQYVYLTYANTEFSESTPPYVFIDNNVYVNKNGSQIVAQGPSIVDTDYAGQILYGDSLYALCDADRATYPIPAFGTATRRLRVEDNFGNVVLDSTVNAASNVDVSWSPGGGNRRYYVRGWSYFSWPTAATLTIQGMYADVGTGYYAFQYFLNTAVDGDFTITPGGGISADMYFDYPCTGASEVNFGNSAASTVLRGQYQYGYVTTGQSSTYGFGAYKLQNIVFINGEPYGLQHGDTFVRGVTTVTININTSCGLL
jgi:hypothetical protein